jgi:hypothetical protein
VDSGRCEPLTIRDEFSRYVLELWAVDNARSQTVREAFERIFDRQRAGLARIEPVVGVVGGLGDRF